MSNDSYAAIVFSFRCQAGKYFLKFSLTNHVKRSQWAAKVRSIGVTLGVNLNIVKNSTAAQGSSRGCVDIGRFC